MASIAFYNPVMKFALKDFPVLLICILLLACNEKIDSMLKPVQVRIFDFRGYAGMCFSGVLHTDSSELVYLANPANGAKIDFFSDNGKKVLTVPLTQVLEKENGLESIYCVAPDTIIVKGFTSGNVYFLNQKGQIWKKTFLKYSFDNNKPFESTASLANNNFYTGGSLIFHCAVPTPVSEHLSLLDAFRLQAKDSRTNPYFLTLVDCFKDTAEYRFGNTGFYARFISDDHFTIEPPMYTCTDAGIFLFSVYCDSLYQINPKTTEIQKAIKISSKYSQIGAAPMKIREQFADSMAMISQTSGLIINVTYDKYRQFYYLSVRHKVAAGSTKKERANFSPWSIIVLDKQLKFVQEVLMKQGRYNPGDILVVKEGLLIFLYPERLLSNETKFELFHVKE